MLSFTGSYLLWTEANDITALSPSIIAVLSHLTFSLAFGWMCTYVVLFLSSIVILDYIMFVK